MQARPERTHELIGVTVGGPHHLAEISGEACSAFETPVRCPGIYAALRQILPTRQHVVQARMPRNMMIEILTGVGFVVHHEAPIAETKVLDEDGVAGNLAVAPVGDFHPPQPYVQARMQPEGDPMADAALLSFPDKAIIRGADAESRLWPDNRQDRRLGSADAQIEARHAVGDGRSERLVDHDPTARCAVLDGENRATGQKADRQPEAVDDPRGVEIL